MTRFERKILFAILLVALGPLIGSLVLGRAVLREAYQIGVNEEFGAQLEQGVQARRAHLLALRSEAARAADAIAFSVADHIDSSSSELQQELGEFVERYEGVHRVTLSQNDREVATATAQSPLGKDDRTSTESRELPAGHKLDVVVTAPAALFDQLQAAGQAADVYSRLQDRSASVARVYAWAYAALLLIVIAAALATGVILSRRVTQRVASLARATRQVGKGDLTVSVPSGATDEVTELTEAFNDMVRDLRESRARIEYLQRIGAWQDFARRLAHEIKNPLTPIQLAAQEIETTYGGADAEFQKKLGHARAIIEEEVATLRRLVTEFSAFAKLPQADLAPADLGDFVRGTESSITAILDDVGRQCVDGSPIEVTVNCATQPMPVRIDAMMLKRCIDNLVRNAVQAVRQAHGGDTGRVELRAAREGTHAKVVITDNGPGIPRQDWERVFDPYYTTKTEGTGLGLPIVKKVVLEHGGEINVRNAPEGGARFEIELPLLTDAA